MKQKRKPDMVIKKIFSLLAPRSFNCGHWATALAALSISADVYSNTVQWPGAGACSSTLQMCIDSTMDGDRLEIGGRHEAGEVLIQDKNIEIIGLHRQGAHFGPDTVLRIVRTDNTTEPLRLSMRELSFDQASVFVWLEKADGDELTFQRLSFRGAARPDPGNFPDGYYPSLAVLRRTAAGRGARIWIHSSSFVADESSYRGTSDATSMLLIDDFNRSGAGLEIGIEGNRFRVANAEGSGYPQGAISMLSNSSNLVSRVHANQIELGVSGSRAILLDVGDNASVDVSNNSIVGRQRKGFGVTLNGRGSEGHARVYNNSIAGIELAFQILAMRATVFNNIASENRQAFDNSLLPNSSVMNNMLWGEQQIDGRGAGQNIYYLNPQFVDAYDLRLRPSSPAIDRGLENIEKAALIFDANGESRRKGVAVDLGAFEHGDFVIRTDILDSGRKVPLQDDRLGDAGLFPIASVRVGFDDSPPAPDAPDLVSFGRGLVGNSWYLGTDSGENFQKGDRYHTLVSGRDSRSFMVTANAGNVVDGEVLVQGFEGFAPGSSIVVASRLREDGGAVSAPPHPVIARHSGGFWRIRNTDGAEIAAGERFVGLGLPKSHSAFIHSVEKTLRDGSSVLSHPLLDANECAAVVVSAVDHGGTASAIYSDTLQKWTVKANGRNSLVLDERLAVIIGAQGAEQCTLPPPRLVFSDSFE